MKLECGESLSNSPFTFKMRRYNVVSLHCAANRVTAEIICAETLTWFKPGAQLINVTGAGAYTQPHLSPT